MGTFNDSGYFTVKQEGAVVASLDMNFLYEDGCPTLDMLAVWHAPTVEAPVVPETTDYSDSILALLGDLNLCSREYKSRMYDGEVKGLSVVKPFVGSQADVPSDATVLRVNYESDRGAVLAEGINPWYSDIDTYAMTTSVIDDASERSTIAALPDRSSTRIEPRSTPAPPLRSSSSTSRPSRPFPHSNDIESSPSGSSVLLVNPPDIT